MSGLPHQRLLWPELCETIAHMAFWLVKTEPHVYSIDDLRLDRFTAWTGVRNYQARNFLRQMRAGDSVLIYHSNAQPPGVVGVATVKGEARPDPTQFDRASEYFDQAASESQPRWFCPDLAFQVKFSEIVPLELLRGNSLLEGLLLFQRGSRLSVLPVSEKHFEVIEELGESGSQRAGIGKNV